MNLIHYVTTYYFTKETNEPTSKVRIDFGTEKEALAYFRKTTKDEKGQAITEKGKSYACLKILGTNMRILRCIEVEPLYS